VARFGRRVVVPTSKIVEEKSPPQTSLKQSQSARGASAKKPMAPPKRVGVLVKEDTLTSDNDCAGAGTSIGEPKTSSAPTTARSNVYTGKTKKEEKDAEYFVSVSEVVLNLLNFCVWMLPLYSRYATF
jgi:hypothetical protein